MNNKKICPRCGEAKIFTIDRGNYYEHNCEACDYQFTEDKKPKRKEKPGKERPNKQLKNRPGINLGDFKFIFTSLNKFSGILVFILLIILLVLFTVLDSQIQKNNLNTNIVNDRLEEHIDNICSTTNLISSNVTSISNEMDAISARLSVTEGEITSLETLFTNFENVQLEIEDINKKLENINENISDLWVTVTNIDKENGNITFTYYPNQTGDIRYCHIDFLLEETEAVFKEVKFGIQYQKANISLMNWTSFIKPQQHQWLNGTFNDSYYLHWFEKNKKFSAKFNVTWDVSDYNTSKISTDNLNYILKANSVFINVPEIWEEEV